MIALNLRGKSNDRLWFAFFHEAGHVLNDSKKETYVDVDGVDEQGAAMRQSRALGKAVPKSEPGNGEKGKGVPKTRPPLAAL